MAPWVADAAITKPRRGRNNYIVPLQGSEFCFIPLFLGRSERRPERDRKEKKSSRAGGLPPFLRKRRNIPS